MIVETTRSPIARLTELRHFMGPSRELWPPLAEGLASLAHADRCLLALGTRPAPGAEQPPPPTGGTGGPVDGLQWGRLHDWSDGAPDGPANGLLNGQLVALATLTAREGTLVHGLNSPGAFVVALRLPVLSQAEICVAICLLTGSTEVLARAALESLLLVQDTVYLAQEFRQARDGAASQQRLGETLEALAIVQDQSRFYAAGLALCGGLADRFQAERVSLGWMRGPSIQLRAVSRTERINRQMELAQALEAVMEEAVDQDNDLTHPDEDGGWITREHEKFSAQYKSPNISTFLLRAGEDAVGALVVERAAGPLENPEIQQIRVVLDLLGRRLDDLERRDRWIGARAAHWIRQRAAFLIGPRHTWAKLLGLGVFALILVLVFFRMDYRVEGSFHLRAEQLAQLGVPFDGFIGQTYVRPGDIVTNGQPLLQLDIRDIVLEEAAAAAELQRYQREMEKARAAGALGDMRVAEALSQQSAARLAQLRNRLEQASMRSPFDGVVIEGDFHERLGQPVRQGDPLFRVARLDRLYVEAEVPERDVHELTGSDRGEVAFLSQPGLKFEVQGRMLEPAAVPRQAGNVFLYRCDLAKPPEAWFRPGMQGVAKIEAGRRRLIWVLTHRTLDFLRLHLWW
ncbi:MAG: efflux RND transporter periplasmic adaptor subunit [Limisphaerales bacterium]